MRRIAACVLAAAVVAGALTPAVGSGSAERWATWNPVDPQEPSKACPRPVWPAANSLAPAPGRGRRVLVLGDSLTNYSYRPLAARLSSHGWLPTIVCWGGTQTNWGLKQAKDVSRRKYLPDRVVIAFGTNDVHKNPCSGAACRHQVSAFGRRAQKLLTYLGPDRKIWWLNIDMDADRAARALDEPWNRNFPAFNAELARVVAGHSNVTLIDWHSIVKESSKPIEYTWDGLHYSPTSRPRSSAGTMLRVRTIVHAVDRSA